MPHRGNDSLYHSDLRLFKPDICQSPDLDEICHSCLLLGVVLQQMALLDLSMLLFAVLQMSKALLTVVPARSLAGGALWGESHNAQAGKGWTRGLHCFVTSVSHCAISIDGMIKRNTAKVTTRCRATAMPASDALAARVVPEIVLQNGCEV
jgi:hypothetical protein